MDPSADCAAHLGHDRIDDLVDGHLTSIAGRAILDLDRAGLKALAHDDDGRDSDQLCILELHTGRDLDAVVIDDRDSLCCEGIREPGSLGEDLLVLAGGHQVDVGGSDLAGPHEAYLVVAALGHCSDGTTDAHAVGTHGHGHELAVPVEDLELQRLGELLAQLEDVAHLDSSSRHERALAVRARGAVAHRGRLDLSPYTHLTLPTNREV